MKLAIAIALVFAAGAMCGVPICWAATAKLNVVLAVPFSLLFIGGLVLGAIWAGAPL